MTLSFTESDIFASLRTLLLQMLPTGVEVVRSQTNRVPEPRVGDFVVFTPINRTRLAMNTDTYSDGFPEEPGVKYALQPTRIDVQLDVHGPSSGDNVQIITTLFRDDYATTFFDASAIDMQALYTGEPHQMPFINGENQFEDRWVVDVSLQVNQVVEIEQQFADTLVTGVIEVDTTYPP